MWTYPQSQWQFYMYDCSNIYYIREKGHKSKVVNCSSEGRVGVTILMQLLINNPRVGDQFLPSKLTFHTLRQGV